MDGMLKVVEVIRDEIGQVGVLGMIPNHFHRIKVRGIAGQPFDLEPIDPGFLQQAHCLAMDTVTIQHQDELAPQVAMDQVQKGDQVMKADLGEELKALKLKYGQDEKAIETNWLNLESKFIQS